MKRVTFIMLAAALVAVMASTAAAETITSNTFSLGYGYVAVGTDAEWNDSETSASNTDVTGDFTLSVALNAGQGFSSSGPTFAGRTLATGTTGDVSARTDMVGITVTAAYTGSLAGNGTTPMKLVIDSISIYAGNYSSLTNTPGGTDLINWSETTTGNTGSSSQLDLGATCTGYDGMAAASSYDQLTWNPGDVAVAGTSSARSFELACNGPGFTIGLAEGFEVTGHIEYAAVPEPSTLVLLVLGGLCLAFRRRK